MKYSKFRSHASVFEYFFATKKVPNRRAKKIISLKTHRNSKKWDTKDTKLFGNHTGLKPERVLDFAEDAWTEGESLESMDSWCAEDALGREQKSWDLER